MVNDLVAESLLAEKPQKHQLISLMITDLLCPNAQSRLIAHHEIYSSYAYKQFYIHVAMQFFAFS